MANVNDAIFTQHACRIRVHCFSPINPTLELEDWAQTVGAHKKAYLYKTERLTPGTKLEEDISPGDQV